MTIFSQIYFGNETVNIKFNYVMMLHNLFFFQVSLKQIISENRWENYQSFIMAFQDTYTQ